MGTATINYFTTEEQAKEAKIDFIKEHPKENSLEERLWVGKIETGEWGLFLE